MGYEMLTGFVPFHADTPLNVLNKHVRDMPENTSRHIPGISHEVDAVFALFFFFQAEDGIRDPLVTGFRRVLFRSCGRAPVRSRADRRGDRPGWRGALPARSGKRLSPGRVSRRCRDRPRQSGAWPDPRRRRWPPACCLQYRYITAAATWRGQKFALAHLTDIPGRLRLIYVRANKSSARPVTEARRRLPASARCMAGYQGVGPITRGRARGPPTMLSLTTRYQPGLVRRFLERAYLGRSACVVSNQGSGAAGGHQYQRDLRVRTGRERRRLIARVAAGR